MLEVGAAILLIAVILIPWDKVFKKRKNENQNEEEEK